MKKQNLLEIQKDLILRYHIIIDEHSTCRMRMHAHIDERKVCKWKPKNSMRCTFDLFHEVGHIETTKQGMKRAEQEYYATCWVIDRCREYNLAIPEEVLHIYQRYMAQCLSFHFPSFIREFRNGVAQVDWQLNPDGRYYMDDDGYGMTPDVEINIHGFIDRNGHVLVKFRYVSDNKELEVMRKEAEQIEKQLNNG